MRAILNPSYASRLIRNATAQRNKLYPRIGGLHVSDLVYCRRKAWYRLHGYPEPALSDDTLTLFLHGHSVHAFLEQGRPEVKLKLRLADQDVHGTVDFVEFGPCRYKPSFGLIGTYCDHMPACNYEPVEFKSTRTSANKPVEEMQQYLDQLAAYAIGLQSLSGRLIILHIMGDYKAKRTGILNAWDMSYTLNELDTFGQELDARARSISTNMPPELPCHRTWECKECPFNQKNGGPCASGPGCDTASPFTWKWDVAEQREVELPDALSTV